MKVLFVCSGNVYRSLSAERLLKKLEPGWAVRSAGIHADPEPVHPVVVKELEKRGISVSDHKQRRIEQEHLDWADVVICMGKNHIEYLLFHFGYEALLFEMLAEQRDESVLDVDELLTEAQMTEENMRDVIAETIAHIDACIPALRDALARNA